MKPQFEVTVIMSGEKGSTPEQLKIAIGQLFKTAQRFPPDGRFDWRAAHIETEPYVF